MTPFDTIYPLALIVIQDYKLDKLAKADYAEFMKFLDMILINAIPRFTGHMQSLEYDLTTKTFYNKLTIEEVAILADLMVWVWFTRTTNDITQFNLHFQARDKKTHSESANLKEKTAMLVDLYERVMKRISDYQLLHFDQLFGMDR